MTVSEVANGFVVTTWTGEPSPSNPTTTRVAETSEELVLIVKDFWPGEGRHHSRQMGFTQAQPVPKGLIW